MRIRLKGFGSSRRGLSAIEYALLAGLLALGVSVGFGTVKDKLTSSFSNSASHL